ncbi:Glycerol-3-phosphate acyltransferase 1 [Lactobacillus equicursoris DSM 19284 = JCM 14600 = CIP 110162]|uniref:Glycerol-3-phosphate acyltransferase n=1 Tax=Lactobacillus equicursoris DSM 19284 = JCM 14600 = CIP 110162 TaxID=1293597 RepID=K0NM26_9LACO|nr:glycerol-3-phosphate acyltransferase [Lactobacillus equicursoris]KRL03285.1 membrane protein [Lactobacillus equicursoris DSM 19284 = JCM 14600 = CIP 110162]CCK85839.1 Glycerol-3-phosphate acyltransferase 1 [Lactobacillus equicursoris DSM 19284 = JCM 14600 = CIP 110162]CCK86482.1 Glycerol-3-phosphate acyltransferase 1 [Lactobacillus equicursoris DSM 19284 = JCM 14600 = CIP 110162]
MEAKIIAVLIGYIFGNFMSAMFVGKFYLHQDPTKFGSGNPGTANVGAVFGKKAGIMTCVGDLLKTLLAIGLVYAIYRQHLLIAYTGLGVVIGHCFPIMNHFKGGKAVAVMAMTTVLYDTKAGLITLLIALFLTAVMQNLTIPPLVFMLLFSFYELSKSVEAGVIFLIITGIMAYKFKKDIYDFFTGHGKRVDILYSIKKKLGILK